MELRFDGRVAIITGGGGGLGRRHALLLASRGAHVVVNDVGGYDADVERVLGDAEGVAAEIREAGGSAVAAPADITDKAAAASVVARALDEYGRVDIVVNNAGILRSRDFADMDDLLWDQVLNVNLRGAFLVTRAAWPHLGTHGAGRVVFITSNSGLLGVPGSAAYAASKAAMWGLIRVLAIEGKDLGIHTNGVAPIAFTDMSIQSRAVPQSWRDGTPDEWGSRLDGGYISPVVAWLAHEDCGLNGEVLSAAAGRIARFFMGLTPGVVHDELTIELVRDSEAEILAEDGYDVLDRAFEEGRRLRRRILGGRPV